MKNNLAKIIRKHRVEAFDAAMNCCMQIMTIALNDEFGFGRDRLLKLEKTFNSLFEEYGCLVTDDISYGNKKLKERVEKIMGKEDEGK